MKRITFYLVLALIAGYFFSCKEIGPQIDLSGNGGNTGDTTGTDTSQQKIVLIEEFTAVQCTNCPKGHTIVNNLLQSDSGRIEVVEIHSGDLAKPYNDTDPDFRTIAGDQLSAYLGPVPFQPSAAIDRKLFPGQSGLLIDRNLWTQYVNQELDSINKVTITLTKDYNSSTRELKVTMKVYFKETVTDVINASLMLTESGIVAPQLDGTVIIDNYVHDNVFRDMIDMPYYGVQIDGDKVAGTTWSRDFTIILSNDWNADSCRIVGFASKSIGTYDVLQAAGIGVRE
jgi:hypothetical protein